MSKIPTHSNCYDESVRQIVQTVINEILTNGAMLEHHKKAVLDGLLSDTKALVRLKKALEEISCLAPLFFFVSARAFS